MTDAQQNTLRADIEAAAGRADVAAAVESVYADLQAQIDARRPRCDASGRCCKFESFGHRLYVTSIELAAFLRARRAEGERRKADGEADSGATTPSASESPSPALRYDGCPYQIDGLCSVHAVRPFGCRVFFCDPTADDWQEEQYRVHHVRLKLLHEELGVTYAYIEWREALSLLDLGRVGPAPPARPPDPRLKLFPG